MSRGESSQRESGLPSRNQLEPCANGDLDPVLWAGNENLTLSIPESHRERVRLLTFSDRRNTVGPVRRRFGPQAWKHELDRDRVDRHRSELPLGEFDI